MTTPPRPCLSRRSALIAAGGAAGAVTLAACATEDAAPAPSPGAPIATAADVPVGGAILATTSAGDKVLLTQPTDGEVLAFSAVCTHAGCTVEPGDGDLSCPCHGSRFDIATGDVLHGPAQDPLPPVAVEVAENGDITTS